VDLFEYQLRRNHDEKLRGPRFGFQHRGVSARPKAELGVGCGRGSHPTAVRFRGYYPRKIFENSDAKSCILMITVHISGFLGR